MIVRIVVGVTVLVVAGGVGVLLWVRHAISDSIKRFGL